MEKQPLLQYYADETWGYDTWDEESKKKEGVRVKFQQEENETRENFFKRLGFKPMAKRYGSNLEKDKKARSRDFRVREDVANQGYGLDILVHDKDGWVRRAVAWQGFGLDILVHDKDYNVREAVAHRRYGLDILVNDEDWHVRQAVAIQGFGLDALVHDKNPVVRDEVEAYLHDYDCPNIEAWIEANPKNVADKKNRR